MRFDFVIQIGAFGFFCQDNLFAISMFYYWSLICEAFSKLSYIY